MTRGSFHRRHQQYFTNTDKQSGAITQLGFSPILVDIHIIRHGSPPCFHFEMSSETTQDVSNVWRVDVTTLEHPRRQNWQSSNTYF